MSFDHVRPGHGLIAIGASTGGPQAIEALLTRLPAACPPILITQHMPEHFTRTYAERLDKICPMRVVEAQDRQVVESGVAYVAPGNRHMLVEREGVRLVIRLSDAPTVHHQRPAVDVLFHSVAKLRAVKVVALLLTGMGQDGADGMVELRQHGAETIAEHEQSCVVFGMPREAIARGGAGHVASLLRMPSLIADCFAKLLAAKQLQLVAQGFSRRASAYRLPADPSYKLKARTEVREAACLGTRPRGKEEGGLTHFLRTILTGSGRIVSFSTISFTSWWRNLPCRSPCGTRPCRRRSRSTCPSRRSWPRWRCHPGSGSFTSTPPIPEPLPSSVIWPASAPSPRDCAAARSPANPMSAATARAALIRFIVDPPYG